MVPIGLGWLIVKAWRHRKRPFSEVEPKRVVTADSSRIKEECHRRTIEETHSEPGVHQFWLSRCVEHGVLKHWTLGVGDKEHIMQYELRDNKVLGSEAAVISEPEAVAPLAFDRSGKYHYKI